MSRNFTIVLMVLIIVILAGYLVWLKSHSSTMESQTTTEITISPTPSPTLSPGPSASASAILAPKLNPTASASGVMTR